MSETTDNSEVQEAIVVQPHSEVPMLSVERDPVKQIEEARQAAKALKDILDKKQKKVIFNGEQYLEFEDWQTIASFYGVTPRVREVKYIEYGDVKGFEAFAEAVTRDLRVISSADAICLNDEKNWSTRPLYEWKKDPQTGKARREKVGDESVPLFQLRSMAQTRACAKALRNVFGRVVVLAGYRATPSEEMDSLIRAQNEKGSKEAAQAIAEEKIRAAKTAGLESPSQE